jgi:hypothetical protein
MKILLKFFFLGVLTLCHGSENSKIEADITFGAGTWKGDAKEENLYAFNTRFGYGLTDYMVAQIDVTSVMSNNFDGYYVGGGIKGKIPFNQASFQPSLSIGRMSVENENQANASYSAFKVGLGYRFADMDFVHDATSLFQNSRMYAEFSAIVNQSDFHEKILMFNVGINSWR